MAHAIPPAPYQNQTGSPARNASCPLSPEERELARRTLEITAALVVGSLYPVETLKGALCGTALRRWVSFKNAPHQDPANAKALRLTSLLTTTLFTAYSLIASKPSDLAPFFLGFGAALSGYELLRKQVV